MNKVVGPGSLIQEETNPESLLNKANQYEYVSILNPLSDDFQVMVAQDIPVDMPFEIRNDGKTSITSTTEEAVKMTYGIGLKNPDHQAKKHLHNMTIIPAGETRNFRGNEAQVVLRQLVNEIMQRRGLGRMLADPNRRLEIEQEVVINRASVQELMDGRLTTPAMQAHEAVNKSNEVNTNEAYPELERSVSQAPETSGSNAGTNNEQKRTVGRPRKEATNA